MCIGEAHAALPEEAIAPGTGGQENPPDGGQEIPLSPQVGQEIQRAGQEIQLTGQEIQRPGQEIQKPGQEIQEDESASDEEELSKIGVANSNFVVKLTRKTKYARLHTVPGCHYSADHRRGTYFESLEAASYDGFCRKCFPSRARPISNSQVGVGPGDISSASSSESSSSDEGGSA